MLCKHFARRDDSDTGGIRRDEVGGHAPHSCRSPHCFRVRKVSLAHRERTNRSDGPREGCRGGAWGSLESLQDGHEGTSQARKLGLPVCERREKDDRVTVCHLNADTLGLQSALHVKARGTKLRDAQDKLDGVETRKRAFPAVVKVLGTQEYAQWLKGRADVGLERSNTGEERSEQIAPALAAQERTHTVNGREGCTGGRRRVRGLKGRLHACKVQAAATREEQRAPRDARERLVDARDESIGAQGEAVRREAGVEAEVAAPCRVNDDGDAEPVRLGDERPQV